MNKFFEMLDIFSRKTTLSGWLLALVWSGFFVIWDSWILLTDMIPSGNIVGSVAFWSFVLFFLGGLIFQLFNKPPKLFMVIHTRTGVAILKKPVTEEVAKVHSQGIRGDSFTYVPYKDYLKTKEESF